jgi:hypothetical protein
MAPLAAPAYVQGADLPDLAITWQDKSGAVIPFATGYTFTLKVGKPGDVAQLTKTTGFVGANSAPNVTIAWAPTGELNQIPPGTYTADLIATRASDGKQRVFRFVLPVHPAIT